MSNWMETHRAVVFPWNCDVLGHMNVRWYAHCFDDAGWHLWTKIGYGQATMRQQGLTTVVARTATDFVHEVTAGELVVIESAFTGLGRRSVTHTQYMNNADTGQRLATQETVEVFFDLETRKATTMPDELRSKVEAVLVTPD